METFSKFTRLYPLVKTVRFDLKPIGKTKENIEKKGLITQDEQRAYEYEKVKEIIDRFHRGFIRLCLSKPDLNLKSDDAKVSYLEEYYKLISKANRTEKENERFDEIKKKLRTKIVSAFETGIPYDEIFKKDKQVVDASKKGETFKLKDLFKKELIRNHLIEIAETDEEKTMIRNFNKFTTYFSGFHDNRKIIYSNKEKNGTIAYRLIHENLPIFYDNMRSFQRIAESEDVAADFVNIEKSLPKNLNVEHLNEMFSLDYFTKVLTQEQIEVYNGVIGARVENDIKIQGINEYVNKYNQQQKDKRNRLPFLKPLYKMILSDRVTVSSLPRKFKGDEEMVDAINKTISTLQPILSDDKDKSLKYLLQHIGEYDMDRVYISNDLGLTDISQQMFGQYDVFTKGIKKEINKRLNRTKKRKADNESSEDRINKLFKSEKSFSIAYLNRISGSKKRIEDYFAKLGAFDRNGEQRTDLFLRIELAQIAATNILEKKHTNLNQSEEDIKCIKTLLDSFKALQHFVKPLLGTGDEANKDNEFYVKIQQAWDTLNTITPLYNKVRDRLTRKPYSTEKIKLNFENNGFLLGGWVDSQTESDNGTQYGGYIFRKKNAIGEYDFYLGISTDFKLFRKDDSVINDGTLYERLDYYQIKSKTIFGKSYQGNYEDDANELFGAFYHEVNRLKLDSLFLRKGEESIIAYLKRIKETDSQTYNKLLKSENVKNKYAEMKQHILNTLASFKRVPTVVEISKREDLGIEEIYDEISNMPSKSFGYFPVKTKDIDDTNKRDKKPLYLFKISNKDLAFAEMYSKGLRKKRGTDNLHTMYFKALLSMIQSTYDIGSGAVFYREQTSGLADKTAVLRANQFIRNKNKDNENKESKFPYYIIKDRRYTCDKFQFHLSININYNCPKNSDVNKLVHEAIRYGEIEHVIGIDRGERNLLYLSLIDLKGNIIKQFSLNEITNEYNGHPCPPVDYKNLLVEREGNRNEARRNWQKIENIKELKEGYLSQVIHIISKMMVEYKAIVVLEDLNMGFMRGRQKIERQVYEKFEKMLIDKLNCYVDKQKDADEIGGVLHPLQLTGEYKSLGEHDKQSGWLFYIPAWNTSKIDPVTGFVNMFDTRYDNADKTRCFFSKFDAIRYNKEKEWFEFTFDYDNFNDRAKGTRTKWTLCSYGTRIKTFRNSAKNNQWDNEEIVLTDEFKKVFADAGIDINGNLKEAICALTEKKYLEPLKHLMKLLLQMRNSETGTEVDYLLSPVADENGCFYDSRKNIATLPKDADANGAYNIARKGLWAIRKIQETPKGEKLVLAISNKEWLQFAQQKPYLDE